MQAEFLEMLKKENLKIYYKIIEVGLKTDTKDYALDKWQSLNGKKIMRLIIPGINADKYSVAMYGGSGTYATLPQSVSGKALAAIEAIDGAYLNLTNIMNQKILDRIPLSLYRNDPDYFTEKGAFADLPPMDWTQSEVFYPTTNIPNAQNGKSWQLVICYLDKFETKIQ